MGYTSRIKMNKQATGSNANTWGSVLNSEVFSVADQAIAGYTSVSVDINGPIILDTNYGIDQEKFIVDIDNKTNSLVRGEKLLELLGKVINYTASHTHAYPGMAPVGQAHDGTTVEELTKLLQEAPETILNQNIRIN